APATEAFLRALTAPEPELPPGPMYASLERRLSRWVDVGLSEMRETRWQVGVHLDERPGRDALALELWLHAGDDPTLSLPAAQLRAGPEGFAFIREGDPEGDLAEQLAGLRPLLGFEGCATELDTRPASLFLRVAMPQLEERGVPVLLPTAWVRSPARNRADVTP